MSETPSAHRLWLLTGLSGAGKQTAAAGLERHGVVCIDNLPVALLGPMAELERDVPTVAVIDSRQGTELSGLLPPEGTGLIFLDCSDAVLAQRLSNSTRRHPLASAGNVVAQITAERRLLADLRAVADVVVDTSALTPEQLADRLAELVAAAPGTEPALRLTVSSFGFKYGLEPEADWVADVRILPNPFWEPDLRPLTGLDAGVADYVLRDPVSERLLGMLEQTSRFAAEQSLRHRRPALHVAVGCTGGRHRSVAIAEALGRRLREEAPAGVVVEIRHRDVEKPDHR